MTDLEGEVTIMPVIHVHIPAGLADDQVIHIHLQGDNEPVQVQPAQLAQDDTIEGMLRRLEASPSASPHPRDTLAALQEMGYELRLAKMGNSTGQREKYIRFMDPASPAHGLATCARDS